jgi:hypothetical protein
MLNAVENKKEYACYEHRQLIRLLFSYNTEKRCNELNTCYWKIFLIILATPFFKICLINKR